MIKELNGILLSGNPLIYLFSPEEERIMRGIRAELSSDAPIIKWSCIDGLEGYPNTENPVSALKVILKQDLRGVFVFCDIAPMMDRPEVVRILREAFLDGCSKKDRVILLLCVDLNIPDALKKEIYYVEVSPPGAQEIIEILQKYPELTKDSVQDIMMALKGLTENEISLILQRAKQQEGLTTDKLMEQIFEEKQAVVKKTGFLEFSPPKWDIRGLGGQDNLKEWLIRREKMFSQEAYDAGVPIPKGLLIMGISGCGKSLTVKIISSLWKIPLFRLDMNLVFSGMYGTPEAAFHKALRTIESIAPAVLWIDEIENALGLADNAEQISSHIFSNFLTWLQEKPPLIFIAATANKIQALPAEILRKGRFDEVFFCDLPTAVEREEIFKIHLKRNHANLEDFDYKMLQVLTEGWNGAEIEQAIISARTEAFYEKRDFNQRDLNHVIGRIVPLSDTMEKQIKDIRSWAFSRATPASKYGKSAIRRK